MKKSEEENKCSLICQDECQLESFKFGHTQPRVFVTFQFGYPQLFLAWTIVWATFHLLVLFLQPYFFRDILPNLLWFTFFTNWSYIFLTTFTTLDCIATIYVFTSRKDILRGEATSTPWYLQAVWISYNFAAPSALILTVLFYVLLNDDNSANSILKHLVNSIYIMLNLILSAKPFRILHFYIPMTGALVYLLFTLVFQQGFGGAPVYPFLDWTAFPNIIFIALGLVLIGAPTVVLFIFTVTKIRECVASKCTRKVASQNEPV